MIYTALTRQPYGSLLIHTLWTTICSSWVFFNREAHRSLHVQSKNIMLSICLKFQFQLLEEACWTHFGPGQEQDMPTDATAGVGRKWSDHASDEAEGGGREEQGMEQRRRKVRSCGWRLQTIWKIRRTCQHSGWVCRWTWWTSTRKRTASSTNWAPVGLWLNSQDSRYHCLLRWISWYGMVWSCVRWMYCTKSVLFFKKCITCILFWCLVRVILMSLQSFFTSLARIAYCLHIWYLSSAYKYVRL